MKPQSKKSKRPDLQGIRGLAILAVIGFHFYPQFFPNGYLGVDQFFVLSGFLMCMLLKRSENVPIFSLITLFYSKRFKRILPLYFLIIFFSLIALYTVFPDTAFQLNIQSASKALLFLSNRPKTEEEDYFEALSVALDIFTHTWSLSVEIQFYFIVPLIFLIANRLFRSKYQTVYYVSVATASYLFHSLTDDNQAFNSVFARCWQFIIGMLVYLNSNSNKSEGALKQQSEQVLLIENGNESDSDIEKSKETKNSEQTKINVQFLKHVLILLSIAFTMNPLSISATFARPFITISTGILMYFSMDDYVLSKNFLTYFGDISYSLYLIHWPIYSFWKLTLIDADNNNNNFSLILALFVSFFLAAVTFETFEIWYLQLSSTAIGFLVVLLLVSNVFLINKREIENVFNNDNFTRFDVDTQNLTLDDAEKLNKQWNIDDTINIIPKSFECVESIEPARECIFQNLEKRNKYSFSLFGNSWTLNHGDLMYQECKSKAYSMQQLSFPLCEPLYPSKTRPWCEPGIKQFEDFLEKYRPDYGFVFTRFIAVGTPFPKGITNVENDPIYQFMKKQTMKYLKNIKKKLFVLNAMPRVKVSEVGKIVARIRANATFDEINKKLVDLSTYKIARKRHAQLMKDCGDRCESIDYFDEFYNSTTNTFQYFDDKGVTYMSSMNHLTFHGLEKVRHIYHEICRKL